MLIIWGRGWGRKDKKVTLEKYKIVYNYPNAKWCDLSILNSKWVPTRVRSVMFGG